MTEGGRDDVKYAVLVPMAYFPAGRAIPAVALSENRMHYQSPIRIHLGDTLDCQRLCNHDCKWTTETQAL